MHHRGFCFESLDVRPPAQVFKNTEGKSSRDTDTCMYLRHYGAKCVLVCVCVVYFTKLHLHCQISDTAGCKTQSQTERKSVNSRWFSLTWRQLDWVSSPLLC